MPGKVLRPLAGEPMLTRVVERVRRAHRIDEVVVATTTEPTDDALAEFCAARRWPYFRGSQADVLDRYVQTARLFSADAIVRITSDCPMIDAAVLDEVVTRFLEMRPQADYIANTYPHRVFPRGLDVEVVARDALERCHRQATAASHREHVTAYIYQNAEQFCVVNYAGNEDHSKHRWTVDTAEDLAFAERIYDHFGAADFTWKQVLALVEANPDWMELNYHVQQKAL